MSLKDYRIKMLAFLVRDRGLCDFILGHWADGRKALLYGDNLLADLFDRAFGPRVAAMLTHVGEGRGVLVGGSSVLDEGCTQGFGPRVVAVLGHLERPNSAVEVGDDIRGRDEQGGRRSGLQKGSMCCGPCSRRRGIHSLAGVNSDYVTRCSYV